jgi:hypothetical protein
MNPERKVKDYNFNKTIILPPVLIVSETWIFIYTKAEDLRRKS